MKKYIGAFGVVVVGVLVSLLAIAAPGDAIYLATSQTEVLDTAAKRQSVIAIANKCYPGFAIADLDTLSCRQIKKAGTRLVKMTNLRCRGTKVDTLTDEAALDLELSDSGVDITASEVVVKLAPCFGAEDEFDAAASTVFGLSGETLGAMDCRRSDVTPPAVCDYYEIKTDTPANWRADYVAKQVQATIGKVIE